MKPVLLVMAAGMGSRYGGVKQIDSVGANGETLLDYSIFDALRGGFGKVVFVIRRDIEKDFRERLFDRVAANCDASYAFQEKTGLLTAEEIKASEGRTKPWGTIQCVLSAEKLLDGPFAAINSDDFYGKKSFELMAKHLSSEKDHAMIGYELEKTLSKNGTVTRGIAQVKDGYLQGMEEVYKIGWEGDKVYSYVDGGKELLTGKEVASMNFFGYNNSVLSVFHEYWELFKKENITSEKAECLLPKCSNWMVQNGKGAYRVYGTDESWFGMTYKEDRQIVHDALTAKVKSGYYPPVLWEKG